MRKTRVGAAGGQMDLDTLREAAIEATARALIEKHGIAPSEESDEWEEEYRRQFAVLKRRHGGSVQIAPRAAAAAKQPLPAPRGTPEELRWGAPMPEARPRDN